MILITDLNQLIKFYAFKVQKRIQELQHISYNFNQNYDNESQDNHQYQFISIISKYNNQQIRDERDVKMIRKFCERILQIYQFFKMKSSNQNLLDIIQVKIEREFNEQLERMPIKIGYIFSYVHLITKKACIIRPPAQKRRNLSKSIIKEGIKYQHNNSKMAPTLSLFNIQRRVITNAPTIKPTRSITNASSIIQKLKPQQIFSKLYSCIEYDKYHLNKIKEGNEGATFKQMLRRNDKIQMQLKRFDKRCLKISTQVQQSKEFKEGTILSELRVNTIKTPWSNKKRRPLIISKKKHISLKQNITILV